MYNQVNTDVAISSKPTNVSTNVCVKKNFIQRLYIYLTKDMELSDQQKIYFRDWSDEKVIQRYLTFQ